MNNLDDILAIKKLDQSNTLESICRLADQCRKTWEEITELIIPENYKKIENIVVSGMGGSSYGARIVKSLYDGCRMTKIPVELANNYWLPGYVNKNSLIILSSYSGTTEEVLVTAKEAHKREAKIIGLTSGGDLAHFLSSYNYPSYIFNPIHNPSKQPRLGVGYMVIGLIGILAKLGKIPINSTEIEKMISFLTKQTAALDCSVPVVNNQAKQLAIKFQKKIPIFIVADFLEGAAYAVRNQFHETAKQFALYFSVPEVNHHLMEGLANPSEIKQILLFVFVTSAIYYKRNSKRLNLTVDVVKKNGIATEKIVLASYTSLTQTMEFIQIGEWITFYLAMLNNTDPAKIPSVTYFKEKLKL